MMIRNDAPDLSMWSWSNIGIVSTGCQAIEFSQQDRREKGEQL